MTKTILTLALASGVFFFAACGSSNSETSTYTAKVIKDGVEYTCNTEEAFNACSNDNNCTSCTIEEPGDSNETIDSNETNQTTDANETSENAIPACTTNGSTVLVDEGTRCTDGTNMLSCNDGKVTYNGSITGDTININGKIYTCQ